MNHVKDILGGLAGLLGGLAVLAALFVPAYMTGDHNRQKVERLTQVCVQQGYTGWRDDRGGQSGCYR